MEEQRQVGRRLVRAGISNVGNQQVGQGANAQQECANPLCDGFEPVSTSKGQDQKETRANQNYKADHAHSK